MTNHPNRSRTVAAWFKLPGGLNALAVWRKGAEDGEIYADPIWQQNSDERTRGVAESRADDATGAENIVWYWQPAELMDSITENVSIPRVPR